jgi:hypothetical protein
LDIIGPPFFLFEIKFFYDEKSIKQEKDRINNKNRRKGIGVKRVIYGKQDVSGLDSTK